MRCNIFVSHAAVDGAVSDAVFGSYKVLVVGENHCGKTSIIKRYAIIPDVLTRSFCCFGFGNGVLPDTFTTCSRTRTR